MSEFRDPDNHIDEMIENLQGTCKSLSEICELFDVSEDELKPKHYQAIRDEIFKCSTCDWWYEAHEETEGECESCYEAHTPVGEEEGYYNDDNYEY